MHTTGVFFYSLFLPPPLSLAPYLALACAYGNFSDIYYMTLRTWYVSQAAVPVH